MDRIIWKLLLMYVTNMYTCVIYKYMYILCVYIYLYLYVLVYRKETRSTNMSICDRHITNGNF